MTDRIKVGVIGTSWWADMMYLPSLQSHPDAEIAAICGRNAEPARALAEKYGIGKIYSGYRDLLDHEVLKAVIVATPDDTHYEIAMAALERGLHVLCEKPLANSLSEVRGMTAKAEAAGVKNMVLFTWRFLPHMRYLRQLLDEGYIGRCQRVALRFTGDYARTPKYQWRFDGRRANGVVGDLGPHMIDLFRHFSGEVASVSADLQQIVDRSGFEGSAPVNDTALLSLTGIEGARGTIEVSAALASGDRGMKIGVSLYGDKGTLESEHVFWGREQGVTLRGFREGMDGFAALTVPDALLDGVAVDDLTGAFARHSAGPRLFIDAIRQDLKIPMTFADGLKVQEVVDAALISDREGRRVRIS